MYLEYYGLREWPFNVTSDPSFLYLSRKHQEAFSHLLFGIQQRKGFLEITGEIGTGKTTVCRALLQQLDSSTKTAFILNPTYSASELLHAIAVDFGALKTQGKGSASIQDTLNEFLLDQLALGNNVVLIIDEAQDLKPAVLEQIRLLSNLETDKEKLIQIVLVGQPELRDKLASAQLRQLRQRIAVRYHILPLDPDEVTEYVEHRLNVAGSNGEIQFTPEGLGAVYNYSRGIPRLINMVCDKALLAGYVDETWTLDRPLIVRCIQELEEGVAVA
ncbi:MAG: AAA family ATPase [Candidatus Omnitrophica bacterium]|nr:AAA family ATPase [Candidatus Omnitrophota bacterium]